MKLSERLFNHYGAFGEEETAFVDSFENKYNDDEKENLYREITRGRNKNLGAPDVHFLEHIFKVQKPQNAKRYFWSVCTKCKTHYWYSMPFCPTCWDNGFLSSEHTVKVSDEKPNRDKVVRYNKDYTQCVEMGGKPTEKICYNCENRHNGYCAGFGRIDYKCTQNQWDYCGCRDCCIRFKKQNEAFEKLKQEKGTVNLIPIQKIGEVVE